MVRRKDAKERGRPGLPAPSLVGPGLGPVPTELTYLLLEGSHRTAFWGEAGLLWICHHTRDTEDSTEVGGCDCRFKRTLDPVSLLPAFCL